MSEDILMVPIKVNLLIYNCSINDVDYSIIPPPENDIDCIFKKVKTKDESGDIYELPSDYIRGNEDVYETACRILKEDLGVIFDINLLEIEQVLYFREGGETRIEYFFVFSEPSLDLYSKKLDPEIFIWHDAYNPPEASPRHLKTVISRWLEDDYFTDYICKHD